MKIEKRGKRKSLSGRSAIALMNPRHWDPPVSEEEKEKEKGMERSLHTSVHVSNSALLVQTVNQEKIVVGDSLGK